MPNRKPSFAIAIITMFMLIGSSFVAPRRSSAIAAKTFSTPMVVGANNGVNFSEGDIYTWNGVSLTRRTFNNHNLIPFVSPAGDLVAFRQVTPAFVRQRKPNQDDLQEPPTDLYLYNLKTGAQDKIAGQPEKPQFLSGGNTDNPVYTLRSDPAWSPDGSLLAWTEIPISPILNPNGDVEQLVVYDIANRAGLVYETPLPPHRSAPGFPVYSQVAFGPNNLIAVLIHSSPDVSPNEGDAVYVYDNTTGKQIAQSMDVTNQDPNYDNSELIWLNEDFTTVLSCVACATQIDPLTGTLSTLYGTPELYSTLAPNQLTTYFDTDPGNEADVQWTIALNRVPASNFGSVRLSHTSDAAISPDGQAIAAASFAGQGTDAGVQLYTVNPNLPDKVTINVTGIGWGPTAWRVYAGATEVF